MRNFLFTLVAFGFGCGGDTKFVGEEEDTGSAALVCEGAPEVDHDEFDESQPGGVSVTIDTVVIGDPTPGCEHVKPRTVYLHYKKWNADEYKAPLQMATLDDVNFSVTIPKADVASSKMLYYFQAVGPTKETTEPDGPKEDGKNTFEFVIDSGL